jgi:TRAP-type C4-dicarboxylate transport system permease small subunit
VFLAVFFWQACVFVQASASETSPVFGVSRTYWYGVMPLTGAIMAGYSLARIVALLGNHELQKSV